MAARATRARGKRHRTTAAPISPARWRLPDPGTRRRIVRGQGVRHAGLAAARDARISAMIRSSCRTATARPSARCDPAKKNAMSHRMRAFEKLIVRPMTMTDEPFGVYVHWPFCRAKCPYCDFNSHVRHGGIDEARFLAAYLTSSAFRVASRRGEPSPASSSAAARRRLMRPATRRRRSSTPLPGHWHSHRNAEITLEANPTSVEAENFAGYRIGRRQSAVARRAGARRSKPQGARPPAHGGRSAGRARARQAPFRSRVVRPDLCARGADGDGAWRSGAQPRARPRRRSSLAVSAHHRGRHAVRRASCGRLAAQSRTASWRASSMA